MLAQVGQDVLQAPQLVAAETDAGQVIALEQDRDAQLAGQPGCRVQRGRPEDERDPGEASQAS
jgi:hypothetical protein